jgi:hypothetical protein
MELGHVFDYGIPTGVLLVLLAAIWRVAVWTKSKVVEPLVESHLGLIKVLTEHVPKQTVILDRIDAYFQQFGSDPEKLCKAAETAEKHKGNDEEILRRLEALDVPTAPKRRA